MQANAKSKTVDITKFVDEYINKYNKSSEYSPEIVIEKMTSKYPNIDEKYLVKVRTEVFNNFKNYTIETYRPNTFKAEPVLKAFSNRYPNITTRVSKLSAFKKILLMKTTVPGYKNGYEYNVNTRKAQELSVLLPSELRKLKLKTTDQKRVKKIQQKALSKKIDKSVVISNSNEIKLKLCKLLKSSDRIELLHGLLLCSGRRVNELYKTNTKFTRVVGDKYTVNFTGQSKDANPITYQIPILCNSSIFIKAYKQFKIGTNELIKEYIKNNPDAKYLSQSEIIHKVFKKFNEKAFWNLYNYSGNTAGNIPDVLKNKYDNTDDINGGIWLYITKFDFQNKTKQLDNTKIQLDSNTYNRLTRITPHFYRSLYTAFVMKEFQSDKSEAGFAKEILGHSDNYSNIHYSTIQLQ